MKAQGTYAAYLHTEILRVVPTYVVLGICVLILAIFLSLAKFPESLTPTHMQAISQVSTSQRGAYGRLFSNQSLVFAILAMFFYVGEQVSIGSNLIPYLRAYTTLGTAPRVTG